MSYYFFISENWYEIAATCISESYAQTAILSEWVKNSNYIHLYDTCCEYLNSFKDVLKRL